MGSSIQPIGGAHETTWMFALRYVDRQLMTRSINLELTHGLFTQLISHGTQPFAATIKAILFFVILHHRLRDKLAGVKGRESSL